MVKQPNGVDPNARAPGKAAAATMVIPIVIGIGAVVLIAIVAVICKVKSGSANKAEDTMELTNAGAAVPKGNDVVDLENTNETP